MMEISFICIICIEYVTHNEWELHGHTMWTQYPWHGRTEPIGYLD